jgi:iron complex outermembrane receptor protein
VTCFLNKIAGVYMQQGALNTNKLQSAVALEHHLARRIKTYFDNIPLTNAEGESSIEDIDLETIGRIEIIKGPNATSFGAGLGGTIHLLTNNTAQQNRLRNPILLTGSGLLKQSFSGGFAQERSSVYANYSFTK